MFLKSKKISFLLIAFFSIAFNFNSYTSAKPDTLAVVNGEPITGADFQNRFELSVYPGKDLYDNLYSVKRGFLKSMIAEKLLSNASLDNSTVENNLRKQMQRIFLRDALYRIEVLPKAKVSEEEIAKGIILSNYNYILDTYYFPDLASAKVFYNSVMHGSSIYSLRDSMHVRHDTLEIGYGESNENIEDAFFGHEPGFVSKPTLTEDGFVIFKIVSRSFNKKFTAPSLADKTEMIKKIIKQRKEEKIGYDYLMSVMKGIKVEVNYKIFRPLIYTIKSFLDKHAPPSNYEPGYYLTNSEIFEIKEQYSSKLNDALLRFKGGDITLNEALDQLPLSGFAPASQALPDITESLHSALRFIIQNHFLAERARKLGLQNSNEVKYNVQMFDDAYKAAKSVQDITDTVKINNRQITQFFEDHKDEVLKDVKLRLQIFKLENLDQAAEVLNKLNDIKHGAVDTSGAVWLYASQLSEIGAVLAEIPDGKVYGPLLIKGKYTIFRVLGKKSSLLKGAIKNSIQDAKNLLLAKKKHLVLNEYLARLAKEQKVKIFLNRLKNIKVTPVEMLTFRYIGFGGKIIAVPSLYPMEDWTKYYNKRGEVIP